MASWVEPNMVAQRYRSVAERSSASQSGLGLRVGVERGNPGHRTALSSEIGRRGKADIVARILDLEAIVREAQVGDRMNCGRVVNDHHLEVRHGLVCERFDAGLQQGARVIVDDDDTDPRNSRRSSLRHSQSFIRAWINRDRFGDIRKIAISSNLEFWQSAATNHCIRSWASHRNEPYFRIDTAGPEERSPADCRNCRSGSAEHRPLRFLLRPGLRSRC